VPVQRDNPYGNFNFVVELGGAEAGFREVDLPAGEIDVIEYRDGSDKSSSLRKLPGLVRYPNVVLRRGVAGRTELFEWWRAVRDGQPDRRTVVITLLDEQRQPVQRWVLRNAWPARIDYGSLDARGNDVAVETLELVHEGFELD
jgi:phage tail-like protein